MTSGFFIIILAGMTNKIIIDGWNLAWKIPGIAVYFPDNLEHARMQLNLMLKNHFQKRNVQFKVIYDGKPGIIAQKGYDRSVETKFSRDPDKADHLIIKFIHRQKNPGQWTVITSDRELAGRVRNLGAQTIDSESFSKKIHRTAPEQSETASKTDPNLKPEELDFWLDKFKED